MHPYVTYILYRERLAQFEREAEIRRHLPKREHPRLKRFGSLRPVTRRRPPVVSPTALDTCSCR